ncbi:Dip2/Utp12 family-domain-containing protein [Calycina marina]|uniref:Dip2/Utp12 family-domain-containing protein n=1 Tax=Calycina marina TaxID=1763456 RepID=A0A9P8CKV9_9HELO|nr:Dip2/Utp12 family-domain-containing protein [Calycina marina]
MSKLHTKLGQPAIRPSAKFFPKVNVDESKVFVSGGGDAVDTQINSGEVVDVSSESSGAEDGNESEAEEEGADTAMEDAEAQETGEISLGELVRNKVEGTVDVTSAFDNTPAYPKNAQIQPPSGASMGTVLTQALKTNDTQMLESCLHLKERDIIQATILRLDSPLAGILLQKLAERLHRRPGRAGSLMIWVQFTLVAHGGYLATQTNLMKKLKELNRVIDIRSRSLSSLLSLKGKLDMLEAQIELRKSMQRAQKQDETDDEEGVIYVEGQESEEEEEESGGRMINGLTNGNLNHFSDDDSMISEDMPTTNGVVTEMDDSDMESDDDNNLIDDEAEETDAESADEDDIDHDDVDSEDEDDESEDGRAPAKIQKTGKSFSKRK